MNKLDDRNECDFNFVFNNLVLKVEEKRRKDLLKNQNINIIYEKTKQTTHFLFFLFLDLALQRSKRNLRYPYKKSSRVP
jgi:hypothetical protein